MRAKTTEKVAAEKVREGDFLPGLDNGYVVEVTTNDDGYMSLSTEYSRYGGGALPEETVAITFHTAEGEEAYLILPFGVPVTVER